MTKKLILGHNTLGQMIVRLAFSLYIVIERSLLVPYPVAFAPFMF